MTLLSLLDVNVLLATANPVHEHHAVSMDWWEREAQAGWASCPLTQNGFLRISCQPNYSLPLKFDVALRMLTELTANTRHHFWSDDISITDTTIFDHRHIQGHRQLTDVYLLALAVRNGGRLVTFDRRLSIESVRGAKPENLVILPLEA